MQRVIQDCVAGVSPYGTRTASGHMLTVDVTAPWLQGDIRPELNPSFALSTPYLVSALEFRLGWALFAKLVAFDLEMELEDDHAIGDPDKA